MNQQFTPAQVIISQAEYAHLKREARKNNLAEDQELMYKEVIIEMIKILQNNRSGMFDVISRELNKKGIKWGITSQYGIENPIYLEAKDLKVIRSK